MDLNGFNEVEFPRTKGGVYVGFVYILCWREEGEEVPFYVGETHSIRHRLDDYYWADFKAPTDFRVGEAVKYLSTNNLPVIAKYKLSADRREEETTIIRAFRAEGTRLLNDCRPYDYTTANEVEEREKVQRFIDGMIRDRVHDSQT